MINLRELKLGNIIQEEGLEWLRLSPFIFREMMDKPYLFEGIKDKKEPRFKYIPLDQKWMTKLGFIQQMNGEWTNSNGSKLWFRLDFEDNGTPNLSAWNYNTLIDTRGYKYVHEFQNLYSALTGEEINITA
jgi:hypothetical protein